VVEDMGRAVGGIVVGRLVRVKACFIPLERRDRRCMRLREDLRVLGHRGSIFIMPVTWGSIASNQPQAVLKLLAPSNDEERKVSKTVQ
jgi:hypothetical protein